MTSPASSVEQNILPVQALFDVNGTFQTFIGQGKPFSTGGGSALSIIDTTTAGTYYPTFATVSSGTVTSLDVSSTKLSYNASTGAFSSTSFIGALTGNSSGLSGGSTGALPYQSAANTTTFLSAGTNGYVLTLAGGLPTWAAASSGGLTITDDTTTNATRYITFTSATSGSITGANTSSSKLQFNPSTGAFTATSLTPTNALGIAYGGTNSTATATAGGIGYGTGTAHAYTAVGTAGQVLTSNGASAPSWSNAATGTVTSVTGTAPVVSSGGNTPAISMAAANTSTNGYLTSTDWNTFNGKGVGTVTSVNATAGTGISVSGGPITSSGSITVTNILPMVYPGAGVPNSTGSAWGTSYTTSGTGSILALAYNADLITPTGTGIKEKSSVISASNIDLNAGNYYTKTISGTTTFTISNAASSGTVNSFILQLTNGGSATVNWFSGVKWAGGTAPTLTASGYDDLGFFTIDGGTTWQGFVLGKAMA
jgi:hypothetical protein